MRKELTQQFTAYTEDGEPAELYVYTDIIQGPTRRGTAGLKEIRTADGQAVNRLDKGKYQIVATGVVLTSSDGDAP